MRGKSQNIAGTRSPALQVAALAVAALSPFERAALLAESAPTAEKILTRGQVAERFGKTKRAVDQWARRGVLRRVKLPGAKRALGFRASEVENLLRG